MIAAMLPSPSTRGHVGRVWRLWPWRFPADYARNHRLTHPIDPFRRCHRQERLRSDVLRVAQEGAPVLIAKLEGRSQVGDVLGLRVIERSQA